MTMSRQLWVIVHRWAGLTIALFLIVAGSTGMLLAFNDELTDLTQPWRTLEAPAPGAKLLDPIALNRAAQAAAPAGYAVEGLRLDVEHRRSLSIGLNPAEGSGKPYLEASVDPYTARIVHIGEPGALNEGWAQIMPFIYSLHYKLAVDEYGTYAFGIAALIWTLDCFIGFYLTLPVARRRWWAHWTKSWRLKRPSPSRFRLNFDLHRASGLWLWPILLVFAWSSVGMNLREVYDPVMKLFGAESPYQALPDQPPSADFKPDWTAALEAARALAAQAGVTIVRENSLYFDEAKNAYAYYFRSDRDFTDDGSWSALLFYPDGKLARTIIADGGLDDGGADNWFMALHMAQVGGLPYRIFVSAVGLLITMLSVTGVFIWMRKRTARLLRGNYADMGSTRYHTTSAYGRTVDIA
jgi:uncharacterized iron-regulated membrane protein